jgi:hypothetical protein
MGAYPDRAPPARLLEDSTVEIAAIVLISSVVLWFVQELGATRG